MACGCESGGGRALHAFHFTAKRGPEFRVLAVLRNPLNRA
jgi:hypothetical protein